jgi:plasmid stabilization system protein ParE
VSSKKRENPEYFLVPDAEGDLIELLAAHPNLGRNLDELNNSEFRAYTVQSYRILYRIMSTHIEILRVLHSSRDLPKIMNSPQE